MAAALMITALTACGGTPAAPTPVPPTPTPAPSPTLSAGDHVNLGADYMDQGQIEDAIAEFEEAIRLDPDNALAHFNLGVAYQYQGKLDQAIAEYQEAISIDPDYAEAHNNLGIAYDDQGKPDEAIAEYQEAIRINPDYALAHYNLALAYYAQGKPDEAIAAYKEVIRVDPDSADAHYNLGITYYDQGKLDEAITEWQEAIRIEPEDSMTHNNLGRAYFDQGRLDEAITELEEAIELDPDNAQAHFNLGLVYRELNQVNEAIAEFETYLELIPSDSPNRAVVERTIAELEEQVEAQQAEYVNAEGGYSLRYPEDWHHAERGAEVMFVESEEDLDVVIEEAPLIMFAAGPLTELAENLGLTEITDLAEVLEAGAAALDGEAGEIETGEIDGYPAALTDISGSYRGSPYEGSLAIVIVEDWAVQVTGMGPSGQWDAIRPTFVDMLNSLSFSAP
jgi:tetratricopeptide (TPR) repeat protein